MGCHNRGCLGNYDFAHITLYARKRFIDGVDTVSLMSQANSECEREEIALVCMLSVEDDIVKAMQLNCRYADSCKISHCRTMLRGMIEQELAVKSS